MKIACVLNSHGNTDITADTIDALRTYVTKDILMIVDGATWNSWGKNVDLPVLKLEGLYHKYHKGCYKNMVYGIQAAAELWNNEVDYLLYVEADVLFTSDKFKEDLIKFKEQAIWCIGNAGRVETTPIPFLDNILGFNCQAYCYLLGCCLFLDSFFIKKLQAINFFNRFLSMTNSLDKDFFPTFKGYDIGEFLFPTLAVHLGGKFHHFASYNAPLGHWVGDFKKYPMRWQPEIRMEEIYPETCIIHPSKTASELRWLQARKRKHANNLISSELSVQG